MHLYLFTFTAKFSAFEHNFQQDDYEYDHDDLRAKLLVIYGRYWH